MIAAFRVTFLFYERKYGDKIHQAIVVTAAWSDHTICWLNIAMSVSDASVQSSEGGLFIKMFLYQCFIKTF